MEVVIFLLLTWFITALFVFQKKRLILIENLFLFLFFLFLNKNILTLLSLNLGMIMYSNKPHLFICFWMHRNIIVPVLILIFVNGVFRKSIGVMVGWGVFTILVFLLFEAMAIHLKIIQYNMWSFFISFMMTVVYLLIALGISYAYRRLVRKEGMVGT